MRKKRTKTPLCRTFFWTAILRWKLSTKLPASTLHLLSAVQSFLWKPSSIKTKTLWQPSGISFSARTRDFITALDDSGIIVVRELQSTESYEELNGIACMLVDMLNTEAMTSAWVSYSNVADDIMQLSDAYKEARTALEVGKSFTRTKMFSVTTALVLAV